MIWRVGQKIVCVVDGWDPDPGWERYPDDPSDPAEGEVYTIRAIEPAPDDGQIQFQLEEVRHPSCEDTWYSHDGFRPVRTTDISIFTAMLTKVPETV